MNSLTRTTFFYERWRALSAGLLETAGQTFLLLIAVRALHAGPTAKALLCSGTSAGFMLSLAAVVAASRAGWTTSRAAAFLSALGGVAFLAAAVFPSLPVFISCSVLALAAAGTAVPLLTQIFEDNYDAADRGRRYSQTVVIRVAIAAAFSQLAGHLLTDGIDRFQWLLVVYGCAGLFSGFCLARIPSRPLPRTGGSHPFRAMRYVRDDRVFRVTLVCWMLVGFANLMMVPMRVEYLANPRYGMSLSSGTIALVVGVVPNLVRLVMVPVWGAIFDRVNFFALRVVLNIGFAVGILTFFTSNSLPGLMAGALVYGISNAGGDVVWTLWVTKFAPPDRVADYMSVHTFFTGLRGMVAPLVAFHAVAAMPISALGWMSAAMIVVASAILGREIRLEKARDPDADLMGKAAGR